MTRVARPATRPTTSHDTAGHRPTTQPRHGRPGHNAHDLCAQAGQGCAPGAPNPVLTQCTVSESLFGKMFMNTVHEHCSRGFQNNNNNNNNKIKSNEINLIKNEIV